MMSERSRFPLGHILCCFVDIKLISSGRQQINDHLGKKLRDYKEEEKGNLMGVHKCPNLSSCVL